MSGKASHADLVFAIARSATAAAKSRVAASWHRSAVKHGLDPNERRAPDRIEQAALHHRRAALDKFMTVATPRLDALFSVVGQSGLAVFLTDAEGVILDQRLSAADAPAFEAWGLSSGADWSEEREGTNGIGTCLTEQRHVIIHQDEHFYTRNTGMSCIDAPIYGAEGQIVAALDLSSARVDQTAAFNRLIAAQVAQTARAIEAANFRATYARARIVVADSDDSEATTLLAIDQNDMVIGATRKARRVFGMNRTGPLAARPASDFWAVMMARQGLKRPKRPL
jgi:transcriptional regulator of acetoin/glycerol metabolism